MLQLNRLTPVIKEVFTSSLKEHLRSSKEICDYRQTIEICQTLLALDQEVDSQVEEEVETAPSTNHYPDNEKTEAETNQDQEVEQEETPAEELTEEAVQESSVTEASEEPDTPEEVEPPEEVGDTEEPETVKSKTWRFSRIGRYRKVERDLVKLFLLEAVKTLEDVYGPIGFGSHIVMDLVNPKIYKLDPEFILLYSNTERREKQRWRQLCSQLLAALCKEGSLIRKGKGKEGSTGSKYAYFLPSSFPSLTSDETTQVDEVESDEEEEEEEEEDFEDAEDVVDTVNNSGFAAMQASSKMIGNEVVYQPPAPQEESKDKGDDQQTN